MIQLCCLSISALFFIGVIRYVEGETPFCPQSLVDCNSLESSLYSSADIILSPGFMSSIEDYDNIAEICRFFKTPSCSEPVLSQCKGEVVYATKAFKSRQNFICGDQFTRKGISKLKKCVRSFHQHFFRCQQKRREKLEEVTYTISSSTSSIHPWCNLTNDYIICVYSVMALACTTELAEEYNDIVNHSIPVVEAIYGYGCSFGHPLDILKTTTVIPETTSIAMNRAAGIYSFGRNTARNRRNCGQMLSHVDVFFLGLWGLFSGVGILWANNIFRILTR